MSLRKSPESAFLTNPPVDPQMGIWGSSIIFEGWLWRIQRNLAWLLLIVMVYNVSAFLAYSEWPLDACLFGFALLSSVLAYTIFLLFFLLFRASFFPVGICFLVRGAAWFFRETQGQKPYAVWLYFYETSRVGRSIEIEAKLVVAKGWGRGWGSLRDDSEHRYRVSLGGWYKHSGIR